MNWRVLTGILVGVIVICLITLVYYTGIILLSSKDVKSSLTFPTCEYFGHKSPLETKSVLKRFSKAAVASDAEQCSILGKEILVKNGSAVDAGIAVLLCLSLYNPQSSGIGGGHIGILYKKSLNKLYAIDARETAPARATHDMFANSTFESKMGGLSIAVPSEIFGYWEAHKIGGRLKWKDLFEPVIKLCEQGVRVSKYLEQIMQNDMISNRCFKFDKTLQSQFINPLTQKSYVENDTIKYPVLANTFKRLSEFKENIYQNNLMQTMADEIASFGGLVSVEDFQDYKVRINEPVVMKLDNGYTLYTTPPPSSGIITAFIIKLMSKYNLTKDTLNSENEETLFYHRLIEAFKFAMAQRAKLDEEDPFSIVKALQDDRFIDLIFLRINDNQTFNRSYYDIDADVVIGDGGTTHVSIVAPDGDIYSVSSSVNLGFGACVVGKQTGIIYNSQMDDFAKSSKLNGVKPNKRPLSAMSPMIVLDDKNHARLVIGASGATKIITSIAQAVISNLFLDKPLDESIINGRVHYQLGYDFVQVEKIEKIPNYLRDGLEQKGHKFDCVKVSSGVVHGIEIKSNNTELYAYSDFRKNGLPDGF